MSDSSLTLFLHLQVQFPYVKTSILTSLISVCHAIGIRRFLLAGETVGFSWFPTGEPWHCLRSTFKHNSLNPHTNVMSRYSVAVFQLTDLYLSDHAILPVHFRFQIRSVTSFRFSQNVVPYYAITTAHLGRKMK